MSVNEAEKEPKKGITVSDIRKFVEAKKLQRATMDFSRSGQEVNQATVAQEFALVNPSTNFIGGKLQSEDWDDTAILNSFESGIMSFRSKTQSKPQSLVGEDTGDSLARPMSKQPQPVQNKRKVSDGFVDQQKEAKKSFHAQHDVVPIPDESQPPIASTRTTAALANDINNSNVPSGVSPCQVQASASSSSSMNDEALQNMLMAWYYSGYATGRYQALKEMEEAATAAAAVATSTSTSNDPAPLPVGAVKTESSFKPKS